MAEQNGKRDRHSGPVASNSGGRDRDPGPGWPRIRRRAVTWSGWWVLLMSLWVAVDDSFLFDELLAGAGAAALAALAAEIAIHQAGVRFQSRLRWLLQAIRLPADVARDTGVVFGALARTLLRGQPPDSRFTELPYACADGGETRLVLLTGARSLAPNMFVLGIDAERGVMAVHQLVPKRTAS